MTPSSDPEDAEMVKAVAGALAVAGGCVTVLAGGLIAFLVALIVAVRWALS